MIKEEFNVNLVNINCFYCGDKIDKLDIDKNIKTCEFEGDVSIVYFSRVGLRYILGICPACFEAAIQDKRLISFLN